MDLDWIWTWNLDLGQWVVDDLLPDHVGLHLVLVVTVHQVGILTILTGMKS